MCRPIDQDNHQKSIDCLSGMTPEALEATMSPTSAGRHVPRPDPESSVVQQAVGGQSERRLGDVVSAKLYCSEFRAAPSEFGSIQ